jgi:ATP-dependent Lon protease
MKLPEEVPVMTLPNATLFPQALLPLYIFEHRYRKMLVDSLNTNRMFSVAMQRPGRTREIPSTVAGLGLIRVSVGHNDGTSHLVLQGLARVELAETIRYKPYRVQKIRAIISPPVNEITVDAMVAKVRELLEERISLGMSFPLPNGSSATASDGSAGISGKEILNYLDKLEDPGQITDLVSCALLPGPIERQMILETVNLENRLKKLIHFLMAEIDQHRKDNGT